MSQRLTGMSIDRVSLVDKGANARVIALLKRDEEAPMTDGTLELPSDTSPGGVIAWLRKAADALNARLQPVPIAKARTFADVVAGQELSDALYDSFGTLEDVIWSAIYAYDANGQDLSLEAKTALISQDLDEFKAYLLAQMAGTTVAKGAAGTADQRAFGAFVRKVGKKISGSRLERLGAAAEALNSVLAEVAEVVESEGADEPEESDVEKSELVTAVTEAITKGQEPLIARIDALEKATVTKTAEPAAGAEGGETEPTLEERLDTIEKILLQGVTSEGVRKSLAGQDGGTEPVKKSVFAGVM